MSSISSSSSFFHPGPPPLPPELPGQESLEKMVEQWAAQERQETLEQVRKEEADCQTELRKHSLLNEKPYQKLLTSLQPIVEAFMQDPKRAKQALENINLAYLCKGDSMPRQEVAALYSHLLNMIDQGQGVFTKSKELPKGLLGDLQLLMEHQKEPLENQIQTAVDKIRSLKLRNAYTIWCGVGTGQQHEMLCRFECTGKDEYSIFLYNPQNKVEHYNSTMTSIEQEKAAPFVHYTKVTYSEIFFAKSPDDPNFNPILIAKLVAYSYTNLPIDKKSYDLKVDFEALRPLGQSVFSLNQSFPSIKTVINAFYHLEHRRVATDPDQDLFISLQKGNNSATKVLDAFCMERLGVEGGTKLEKLARYKKLSLDVRLMTLLAIYAYYKHKPEVLDEMQFKRLDEAASHFLIYLDDKCRRLSLESEASQCAVATIQHLKEELGQMSAKLSQASRPSAKLGKVYNASFERYLIHERISYIRTHFSPLFHGARSQIEVRQNYALPNSGPISWENLEKYLVLIKALISTESTDIAMISFETAVRKLATLKTVNLELPKPQALQRLAQVETLIQLYTKCVKNRSEFASPVVILTGLELLSVAHKLALEADRDFKLLQEYSLDLSYIFNFAREQSLFSIQDPTLLDQWNELERYFSSASQSKVFNFDQITYEKNKSLPEVDLYRRYAEKNPVIEERWIKLGLPSAQKEYEEKNIDPKTKKPLQPDLKNPDFRTSCLRWGVREAFASNRINEFPQELAHIVPLKNLVLYVYALSGRADKGEKRSWYVRGDTIQLGQETYLSTLTIKGLVTWETRPEVKEAPSLSDSAKKWLTPYQKHPQSSHDTGKMRSENALLVEAGAKARREGDPLLPFYLALVQALLQTALLLNQLKTNLELLKEEGFRQLFQAMINKLIVGEQGLYSPLMEELKNPRHLSHFETLVEAGNRLFAERGAQRSPCMYELLFLMRLYARAMNIVGKLHPEYQFTERTLTLVGKLTDFLTEWQEKDEHLRKELGATVIQEILVAKLALLTGLPLTQLSMAQKIDLWTTYVQFQTLKIKSNEYIDADYVRALGQQLYGLHVEWPKVLEDESHRADFAQGVLQKFGSQESGRNWQFQEGHLIEGQGKELGLARADWKFALESGWISNKDGYFSQKRRLDPHTSALQRLCRGRLINAHQIGQEMHFTDEIWGAMRIMNDGTVQRQINGTWYSYQHNKYSSQERQGLGLNLALYYDHAIWFNPDHPQEVLLCDLSTGKPVACFQNGVIREIKERGGYGRIFHLFYNEKLLDWHVTIKPVQNPAVDFAFLSRFEELEQINGWIGERGDGHDLEFSRYVTFQGKTLSFTYNRGQWTYNENPLFHMDVGGDREELGLSHYLPLADKGRKRFKVLIPVSYHITPAEENSGVSMNILASQDGGKKSLHYYEYDYTVQRKQLVPTSTEGRIYLAHLYLAQKKYQDASALLKQISVSETMTPGVVHRLRRLLTSQWEDPSFNHIAVRLGTYIRCLETDARKKYFSDSQEKEISEILTLYQAYAKGYHHIEGPLVIPREAEWELIHFLESSGIWVINHQKFLEEHKSLLRTQQVTQTYTQPTIRRYYEIMAPSKFWLSINLGLCSPTRENEVSIQYWLSKVMGNRYYNEAQFPFAAFKNFYQTLDRFPPGIHNSNMQGMIYELTTSSSNGNNSRENLLLYLAYVSTRPLPRLPEQDASFEIQYKWYEAIYALSLQIGRSDSPGYQLKDASSSSTTRKSQLGVNRPVHRLPEQFSSVEKREPEHVLSLLLAEKSGDTFVLGLQQQYCECRSEEPALSKPPAAESAEPHFVLRASEEPFAAEIEKRRQFYEEECAYAKVKASTQLALKREADLERLGHEVEQELLLAKQKELELESYITSVSRHTPVDPLSLSQHQITALGLGLEPVKFEAVLTAACAKEPDMALLKLNPYLQSKDNKLLIGLRKACIEYLVTATHIHHLERIKAPLDKRPQTSIEKEMQRSLVEDQLREERHYNPYTHPLPLLVEYKSKMRMRKEQVQIIEKVLEGILETGTVADPTQVFQLQMGGGKTSMILDTLIKILTDMGFLCLFLCHHSQVASVKGNLRTFQMERHGKDIYELDYSIEELGELKNLENVLKTFKNALLKKRAVIMRTSILQLIVLRYLLDCHTRNELKAAGTDASEIAKLDQAILKQAEIINFMEDHGINFFDEGDINLSPLTDVVIPIGEQRNVPPERVDLIREIYQLCLLDPEIRAKIELEKNLQAELSRVELEDHILPVLVDKLFDYAPLRLSEKPHLKEAFKCYVLGTMPAAEQKLSSQFREAVERHQPLSPDVAEKIKNNQNVELLNLLADMYDSRDRYKMQAVQLIASLRRLCKKVLPFALEGSNNRTYGRDRSKNDGSMCTYLAVDTPAKTRTGDMEVAVCRHLQAALNADIEQGEIEFLAKKMHEAADHYSKKENKDYLETIEAKQFFKLTSIRLIDRDDPAQLAQALQHVNDPKHPKRRLAVEAEVASLHIRRYPKQLGRNAINAVMTKKSVVCSGTLNSSETFNKKLGKPRFDRGAAGAILNHLEECYEVGGTKIYEVPSPDIADIIKLIRHHPEKHRIRGIGDAGGLLTKETNAQMALKLMEYFESEEKRAHREEEKSPEEAPQANGSGVEAIVYLHKFSEEEVKSGMPAESFVLLKKGVIHILKNTTTQEIESKGVSIQRVFMFNDEARNTGTDVKLADDAILLLLLNGKMGMRTALQSALRLRELFKKHQKIDFVVTKKGRQEMVNQGQNFAALKENWTKRDGIELKPQKDRAYLASIDDVFHTAILKEMTRQKTAEEMSALVARGDEFFFTYLKDDPYRQEGIIYEPGPILEVLKGYSQQRMDRFKDIFLGTRIYDIVEDKMQELMGIFEVEFKDSSETMEINLDRELNANLELLMEEELQLELTQEQVQLEEDLRPEYDAYNWKVSSEAYPEPKLALDEKMTLWDALGVSKQRLVLPEVLGRTCKGGITTASYVGCFPGCLHMTQNFYQTTTEELPVLHTHSKSVQFMLVMKVEGEMQFVFVSEQEAAYFKERLNAGAWKEVYLLDIQGQAIGNTEGYEVQSEAFKREAWKGLWYAHFFNGDVDFLEDRENLALGRRFVKEIGKMARFIKLRNINSPLQLQKIQTGNLFTEKVRGVLPSGKILFSARRHYLEEKYNRMGKLTQKEVEALPAEDVGDLHSEQISWLKTEEQITFVPDDMVNALIPTQINLLEAGRVPLLGKKELIQAITKPEHINELEQRQYRFLHPSQVAFFDDAKLARLPTSVTHQLGDREQIRRFKGKLVELLGERQVNEIEEDEVLNLSNLQIGWLNCGELIRCVPIEKVGFLNIEARQHLTDIHAILALPDDQGLIDSQKDSLRAYAQTIEVPKDAPIEPIMKQWHVRYCAADHVSLFTQPSYIRQVPAEFADRLVLSQVQHLTRSEAPLLANITPAVIPGVIDMSLVDLLKTPLGKLGEDGDSRAVIAQLQAAHTPYLNNEALNCIPVGLVPDLTDAELVRLSEFELILHFHKEKVCLLTPDQQSKIQEALRDVNSMEAVSALRRELIKFLPLDKMGYVKPFLFGELNRAQAAQLAPSQIQEAIAQIDLNALEDSFIQALNKEAVKVLPATQANRLSIAQVKQLEATEQHLIQALHSAVLLGVLSDEALQLITSAQVERLDQVTFLRLQNGELLFSAPAKYLDWLTVSQEEILKSVIALKKIDEVPVHYAIFLSDGQVQQLTDEAKILALAPRQIALLSADQIRLINPAKLQETFIQSLSIDALVVLGEDNYVSLLGHLSIKQLAEFDAIKHSSLIKHLLPEQLSQISEGALQAINAEQVATLLAKDLNRLIPTHLLHVPARRVCELDDASQEWLISGLNEFEKAKAVVTADHIAALKVELLTKLTEPSFIVMIQPVQISCMDEGHKDLVSDFTEQQISQVELFPQKLIEHLSPKQLKALQCTVNNLQQVPKGSHQHLSDPQLKLLYPLGKFAQVIKGLFLTLAFIPRVAIQFAFNTLRLLGMGLVSLFARQLRPSVSRLFSETFVHAPARALAGLWLLFNRASYQRWQLAHQESV